MTLTEFFKDCRMAGGRLVKECYVEGRGGGGVAGKPDMLFQMQPFVWAACPNVLISFLGGE